MAFARFNTIITSLKALDEGSFNTYTSYHTGSRSRKREGVISRERNKRGGLFLHACDLDFELCIVLYRSMPSCVLDALSNISLLVPHLGKLQFRVLAQSLSAIIPYTFNSIIPKDAISNCGLSLGRSRFWLDHRIDSNLYLMTSEVVLSCLLKEQLLEPALNLNVHCCGREFRVLDGYDQKSFDEERGLN
ncbi:hypothetical protein Tco_0299500 [Tanacetum coccineum]